MHDVTVSQEVGGIGKCIPLYIYPNKMVPHLPSICKFVLDGIRNGLKIV